MLWLLVACAAPPVAGDREATTAEEAGCPSEASVAHGQVVELTGAWDAYEDGDALLCGPAPEDTMVCGLAMRIPATESAFEFQFALLDERGEVLGASGGTVIPSWDAGDPCFGASPNMPLSASRLGEGSGATLSAEAYAATVSEGGEASRVEDGVAYRVLIDAIISYGSESGPTR